MAEIAKLVEELSSLTVLELNELKKTLEAEWDVSAAAPMAVAAMAPAAGAGEAAQVEEQTEFDVVLTGVGDKKIQVIKVVRALTSLGLKEAKALVDKTPQPVKEGVSKDEAEEVKKQIEEVGGSVEIK